MADKKVFSGSVKRHPGPGIAPYDNVDPFNDGSGVALYTFDGNTNDTRGVYNLTAYEVAGHIAQPEEYLQGHINQALKRNINFRKTPAGKFLVGDTSFTISFWAQRDTNPTNWEGIIVQGPEAGYGVQIYMQKNSGNTKIGVNIGTAQGYNTNATIDSTWGHFVIVRDKPNNSYIIYKNGLYIETVPNANSNGDTHNNINGTSIGSYENVAAPADSAIFNGDLDQVRIFNKALTQQEVQTLYNEG